MIKHRIGLLLAVIVLLLFAAAAFAAELDPRLVRLESTLAPPTAGASAVAGRTIRPSALDHVLAVDRAPDGALEIGVVLHLDGPLPDLSDVPGLRVGSTPAGFATARLPLSSLATLARVPGVRYIEAARRLRPLLDRAAPAGRVDRVWNGSPAYTGEGVLVGVIDTGIDWTHDDFRHADGTTRILGIWDFYLTGTPPAGFGAGVEFPTTRINDALAGFDTVAHKDRNGHGTHVMGVAAGNGRASSGQYRGAASGADLLFAKPYDDATGSGFGSDQLIDAMTWMQGKAAQLGRPLVVNLSLGGHFGAHDGTSAQERVIDNLSGEGMVFTVSAGNEAEDGIHAGGPAAGVSFSLEVDPYTPAPGANNDFVVLDLWVEGTSSPTVTVTGPTGGSAGPVASGTGASPATTDGTILVDNAFGGPHPVNRDKEIYIELSDQAGLNMRSGTWTITVEGGVGTVHGWMAYSTMPARFPGGSAAYSVSMPSTATEAVSVAAWKTRNDWPSQAGNAGYVIGSPWGDAPVNDIAPFSSQGPGRDGREKPDLAAPGMAVLSALSKDKSPAPNTLLVETGGRYLVSQGTSMSAPFAAGVLALMFEKNPALTASEARDILRSSARTDTWTGSGWSAGFGRGKIDAEAALAAVGADAATGDVDGDGVPTVLDVLLLVNHVLDPAGHPLGSPARAEADVYPQGGGDTVLNIQDVARIVDFILGHDAPSAPHPASGPALLAVGPAVTVPGGAFVPVELSGEALAGAQFALAWPGVSWRKEGVLEGLPAGVAASAHVAGDEIRVLVHARRGLLPPGGIRIELPLEAPAAGRGGPRVSGALAADPGGFARRLEITGAAAGTPVVAHFHAAPNPLSERSVLFFALDRAVPVRVEIFSVRGARVRTLHDGVEGPGEINVTWDGRDGSGRPAPAGVYLARLTTPRESMTRKIVVKR